MTRNQAWEIWNAIVSKMRENGHEFKCDTPKEFDGDYVDVIEETAKHF